MPIPTKPSQWNCLNFTVGATLVGGSSSNVIPCSPGDSVIFTASIRWLGGAKRPVIGVWFFDQPLINNFGSLEISPPNTDTGWHIGTYTVVVPAGAAVMVVQTYTQDLFLDGSSYFVGFNPAPTLGPPAAAAVNWEVSDYYISLNGNAQYAPMDTFQSNGVFVAATVAYLQEFVFPLYYLGRLTSEYQQAPKFRAWLAALISPIVDLLTLAQQAYIKFDVATAVGVQLDILGTIVGASRILPFQPSGGFSPTLTDDDYRTLLYAKIAQNQWDGSPAAIYALRRQIFPAGRITIIDNQNMSLTIVLAGTFTSLQQDMITNDLIFPRPEGVLVNYTFATLPLLGFGFNNATIAGFNVGRFS